ncbi:kinase-like domain-containing protein [Phaeosphaeriaceae sp. PMI808]|nr:kinase-like domain-containing protein [Phaeosphaeriaceae sp. PMI808]
MLPRLRRLLNSSLFVLPFLLLIGTLYGPSRTLRSTMPFSQPSDQVAKALLADIGLQLQQYKVIQSLWAGYGQICHITATPDTKLAKNYNAMIPQDKQSYILKLITPPRNRADDEGHTRKLLSYQVEQYFYTHLAPQLPLSVPVAKCFASINQHHSDGASTTAILLNDLKQQFPIAGEKRNFLSPIQVNASLDWLSGFHGFWWTRIKHLNRSMLVLPPLDEVRSDGQVTSQKTVWLNGGYTYLATRRKEFASLAGSKDDEWSAILTIPSQGQSLSISESIAAFLAPAASGLSAIDRYETLIHGDVKSENLFTSNSGEKVAFYDFQYTGLGLGVCDLAKLFTCSVPLNMLVANNDIPHELPMQDGEKKLLEHYWRRLKEVSKKDYDWPIFVLHWEIALIDWLRFQASWGFWGNTEWLEARARSILKDGNWREDLLNTASKPRT